MRQSSGWYQIGRWLSTRHWWIGAGLVVIAASVVVVARTDDGTAADSGPALGEYALIAIVGLIAAIVAVNLLLRAAGVDVEAGEIAERLAVQPDQQRLLTRWLERARWARFVGGLSGVIVWIFGTRADGNPFLWGFAGIAAGGVIAELHHLRRPSGPRTARLEVRSVRNYLWPFTGWHMVGTAAAGALVALVGTVVADWSAAALAGGATAVIGVGHLVQRRVASRPRPALPDSLRTADDLARELAIDRNIAWPCTYFGLSLVATACNELSGYVATIVPFLGLVAQFYAIGLWWRNRRLGLDHLLHGQREPVLA